MDGDFILKVLITGGAGFIGSHVTDVMLSAGYSVTVVDNLVTGSRNNLRREAELIALDICDEEIDSIFSQVKPQIVIHLAAQTSVTRSMSNPYVDAKTNVTGTLRILDNCVKHNVQKIIYASSAAVYGTPVTLPINEEHPLQPLSFYGLSKLTPEKYIELHHSLFNIPFTIFRFANVYGPRQDAVGEGGVVSIFLSKLMKQQTPIIYGDGEQTRDFIYVKDIAQAILAAITSGSGGCYNLSTGTASSINSLLRLACSIVGSPFEPQYYPARQGDIIHSILDNTRAKQNLNWQPVYSLETGLMETHEFFRVPMDGLIP